MKNYYIKTNRIYTPIRKYIWIITLLVAIGGLFEHRLGLIVPPLMITLVIMAFLRGRYWCGNFCPHGSLYDKFFMKISRNKKVFKLLQSKIFIGIFFVLFMINFMKNIVLAVNSFGSDTFLDKLGSTFTSAYLMVLIVGGTLSIINSSRSWCSICPMGVMQKASYSAGKSLRVTKKTDKLLTIKDKDMCIKCNKCSKVCPMQLSPYENFDENNRFTSSDCIKCATCVNNCPKGILSIVSNKDI